MHKIVGAALTGAFLICGFAAIAEAQFPTPQPTCVPAPGIPCPGSRRSENDDPAPSGASIRRQQAQQVTALYNEGVEQYKGGNYALAREKFNQALDLDPNNEGVRHYIAVVINREGITLYDHGDYPGARAKYRQALAFDPSNKTIRQNIVLAIWQEGVALDNRGDLAGAKSRYEEALALDPSDKAVRQRLRFLLALAEGKIAERRGDRELALLKCRKALALDPSSKEAAVAVAYYEAMELAKHEDWQGTAARLRQGLAVDPSNSFLRGKLAIVEGEVSRAEGTALYDNADFAGAVAKLKRALELSPANKESPVGKEIRRDLARAEGSLLFSGGNYARAMEKFREAAALDPSNEKNIRADIAHMEGLVLFNRGDAAGAIEKYRESLTLAPPSKLLSINLAKAESELAAALVRLGDWKGAVGRYRIAQALEPSNESLRNELNRAEAKLANQQAKTSYLYSPTGVVGGMGWTRKIYFFSEPSEPELRRKSQDELRKHLAENHVEMSQFAALEDYDFILGVAIDSLPGDLLRRVLEDDLSAGRATPSFQTGYNSLRGRSFGILDCHSNGAMVCLMALRNGDVTARKVRLLGPQITRPAIREWLNLLSKDTAGNKIEDLEIFINDHDPVPNLSYMFQAMTETSAGLITGTTARKIVTWAIAGAGENTPIYKDDQIIGAGVSVRISRLPCAAEHNYAWACHLFEKYKLGIDPEQREQVDPRGAGKY